MSIEIVAYQKFLFGDGVRIGKEFFHQFLRSLGHGLQQVLTPLGTFILQVVRNGDNLIGHTLVFLVPDDALHGQQIDNTLEVGFRTDGHLQRHRVGTQTLLDLTNNIEEVCTAAVHLIDETDTGNIVFGCLTPNGLRLRLHAAHGTEQCYRTVQHAQRTLHFHREVHVPRSVDQVDLVLFGIGERLALVGRVIPEHGGSRRSNGDTTFLLLRHPVHRSGSVVYLAYLVGNTRVVEDTLAGSRFSGIDVRHDTDIAGKM